MNSSFTTLPALPNSLKYLNCGADISGSGPPQTGPITSLPALPNSLDSLNCESNRLTCFPIFPHSITYLRMENYNILCLPNYIPAMSASDTTTHELCGSGNPYSCPVSPTCTSSASFTLVPDATPHTWDVYPTYPSNPKYIWWQWGDGTNDSTLYPSHTYSVAGLYNITVNVHDSNRCWSIYSQNYSIYRYSNNSTSSSMVYVNVVNGTTGINQLSNNNTIKIYPNPASNKITIDANDVVEVKLFDVLGKQIFTTKQSQIDVSSFNDGVYFIQVQTKQGTTTQKIMVQH